MAKGQSVWWIVVCVCGGPGISSLGWVVFFFLKYFFLFIRFIFSPNLVVACELCTFYSADDRRRTSLIVSLLL